MCESCWGLTFKIKRLRCAGCAGFLGGSSAGERALVGASSWGPAPPPRPCRRTRAIVASLLLGNGRALNIVVDFNRKCFQIEMTLITL